MLQKIILIFLLLIFSGCAERGYKLTMDTNTQTIIAQSVTSLEVTDNQSNIFQKMKKVVEKTLKKPKKTKVEIKKRLSTTSKHSHLQHKIKAPEEETVKVLDTSKVLIKKDVRSSTEESRLRAEAQISKELREARLLEANKFKDKTLVEAQSEETKHNSTTEEKHVQLKKQQALEKLLREKRKSEQQSQSSTQINSTLSKTESLLFKQIDKVYHKFGNSEVHGHVIYLSPSGKEIRLSQTKVYLLPLSEKLNYWFNNYYLKNKSKAKHSNTIANYLNKTTLNMENNFEFFGVPEGSYYIIIESNYPSHLAPNKKVYIAKKIQVGKYKKIMGVFSKKL